MYGVTEREGPVYTSYFFTSGYNSTVWLIRKAMDDA